MKDANGQWTGEWVYDAAGKPVPECCHYILTNGVAQLLRGLHAMRSQARTCLLQELPEFYRDKVR